MFLKRIYVNGFKSFAEKTEIVVEKGITAIVGPNGSGKSNISDAIKWVLGEQSAKSLRGGKMDDIIFAGTQKRMPLGYAEVNLIFDNEDGVIPIEYKEVSIKRKLYKTGESEYYINKQQCRLKDVKELFMDTGIGRDGYSFIGQGRVEDILSPNSETRREVFEEAAGIVKYKARKEEAIKKLEKTNDNLDRVQDIVSELEVRIEPLKEQSDKARKYVELKNDLKKYELNYFVHEYEKHNEQLTALEGQRSQSVEHKNMLQRKRDNLENSIVSEKEKINVLQMKIIELENISNEKSKEYENYVSLGKVQSEKRLLYSSNIKNVKEEMTTLDTRNEELEKNIADLKKEKELLINDLNQKNSEFDSLNAEISDYKAELDKSISDIENKKNELFELHKEINRLNSSKSTLESFDRNDEERIEHLNKEIESEEAENKNKEEIVNNIKTELEENRKSLFLKNKELVNILEKNKNNEEKKTILESEIRNITNELNNVKSKLNILSNMEAYYDGYNKSVKTLMNNKDKNSILNNSILGTVADAINTKKDYETAIEIALGFSLQNIIVNSEKEAHSIIEYLKDNKIGRVTILPIDMIQERSLNESERFVMSEACVINTADMLVDTPPQFKKVVKHLLGRIIIVDNLKNGFRISRLLGSSVKIVSINGDVINSGGSVTGGHIANNQNLLGRKREIEEYKKLNSEYSEQLLLKTDELNNILSDIKENNAIIDELKNVINEKNNLCTTAESRMIILVEQLNKTSVVIEKYLHEKEYMINEKNNRIDEISGINKKIAELKAKIEEHERFIEDISMQNEEKRKKYEEFNGVLLNQRDLVSVIRQEISLRDEKINNIDEEIKRNLSSRQLKEENLNYIENEVNSSTKLIDEYKENSILLEKNLTEIKSRYTDVKSEVAMLQNMIYDYQNKINEANKSITEILDDENVMNVKLEREKSRLEDISAKLWEEYEMNYAMALSFKDETVSYNKIVNDVNMYKKSIKELGNINIDSIDEYREVKDRFDFLSMQKKDLTDAKSQLLDVIKELEIKMRDQFLEEFSNIRIKFNDVFQKLFNGGRGDVYIEDENDALNSNIEIAVQPPGKKLSKLSLLSGGEKALTAVALLFAILKTKPTPFCILDEIEAAMDDANIYRLTQYLRDLSRETQFLVITHRKVTMENSDTLYGATMEEKGVTKLVSLKLSEVAFDIK